ncbi:MAG: agmatine deiminase family protein [Bacteroidales bacterium]|nr:agmatine deiminase family protein [Bacteroidales bacterium]
MTTEELKFKHLIGKDFYSTPPPDGPVRNIAEFDRMQGVLVRYPFGISYAVIKEMAEDIMVVTIVEDQSEENYVLNQYNSNGVNTANCEFLHAPTNSYWTRDYGPWFVFDGNDNPGIVNFPYNRPRPLDNDIPIEVATYLGIDLYGMDLIHTGGNYMTDGMGISSSSELVWDENPSLSHTQIDQLMNDYLGIDTYHVVPDPNNTYIDHIDCWGKFLDVDKVLIREVPSTHPQYDEIEATAAYYASQTSAYGQPYQVFRIYTPNDQPYTNSLILNEKVLVPVTGSQWDNDALQTYQDAMPGYEIVGLTGSWASSDALHCRTKGIADIGMLYIHHIPILGNAPVQTNYQIDAEITSHSQQAIYPDSVFIIYCVNSGSYDTILMVNTLGKNYSGTIPGQPYGSEIAYYLFVADGSGRSETHPFIGAPDPHIFYVGEPSYPDISVNPSGFEVTLLTNDSTVEQLSLSNLGQMELDFNIDKQYVFSKAKAYCSSSGGGDDEFILNVTIGSINNTTGQSYYADYTSISTDVNAGESYPVTITNGDTNWEADECGIWVDWNQNEDFYDDTPIIVSGSPGVGPYTADIVPPVDAVPGSTRMRVQIIYNQAPDPCIASFSYGEVEDYALNVYTDFSDWLTIDPITGNVSGQGTTNINLTFNSAGMDEGDYYADVIINCNDPDQPQIIIPVHLIVTGARFVDLKVFLEGPFSGTEMTNDLNVAGNLPLSQPYNIIPWNYTGDEFVDSIPNADVVDWVLIELRDTTEAALATGETMIARQAVFLLNNGIIVGLDGDTCSEARPCFSTRITNNLFVVIWHRNHLGIMSANPLTESGGVYTYDFTTGSGQAYGSLPQKEIVLGIWGLYSGDGNCDGYINGSDKSNIWESQAGTAGYFTGDFNMDCNVDNNDKNDVWKPNEGMGSQVPD